MARLGSHPTARTQRAYEAFLELRGPVEVIQRQIEIDTLASKEWRGPTGTRPPVTVYCLRCHATSGRGPHDCWVPAGVLWALIDLRAYRCVYHAGD